MTADEVLEAMAQGVAERNGYDWTQLSEYSRREFLEDQRAAIRALPAGWVVAKVPEDETAPSVTRWGKGFVDGHNRALAAVRASAVEVDHIAEVSKMVIAEPPHGQ